jgi:hypothetical protein
MFDFSLEMRSFLDGFIVVFMFESPQFGRVAKVSRK